MARRDGEITLGLDLLRISHVMRCIVSHRYDLLGTERHNIRQPGGRLAGGRIVGQVRKDAVS